MNEQKLERYWEFIDRLLSCESGTEISVYQQYSILVDENLPQLMLAYAQHLEQAAEPQDMTWLRAEAEGITATIDYWKRLNSQVLALYYQGEITAAIPIAEQALEITRRIFHSPNVYLTSSLESLGNLYYSQGRWAEADPFFRQALAIEEELCKERPTEDLANSVSNLGVMYDLQGRWAEAELLLKRSLAIRQTLYGDRPNSSLAIGLTNLGGLYNSQGRWAEAEPLYKKALAINEELCGDRPTQSLAISLNNLGGLYYSHGKWAEAELLLQQALAIRQELCSDRLDRTLATSLNSLAVLYNSQGRWTEAEPLYKQALAIEEELSENRPTQNLAISLNNMGDLYVSQGKWSEAEQLFERGLAICQELYGDRPNNDLAASLNDLTELYRLQGRWAEAEPLSKQALAIRQILFGDRPNEDLAGSLNDLASLYELQGRLIEAEPLYKQALAIRQELCGDRPHLSSAISLNNLALLYRSQGRWIEAELLFKQALAMNEQLFGSRPNKTQPTNLNNLGGLYELQGRWVEAEPLHQRALAIYQELFGETGHPDLVGSLILLAQFYTRHQQPDRALLLFQQAIELETRWLSNILPATDRQQRLKDLERLQPHLEGLISLTQQHFVNDPAAVVACLNAVLSRKAQATATEAALNQAIGQRPELAPDAEQLKAYHQEIASLSYALANQPELKDRLNTLLQQRRELEKKLARSIPAIDLAQQVVDRQALTSFLPPDAFLIEFVRYRPHDFVQEELQPARYLAFIIPPNNVEGVMAIDCGEAEGLDRAIDKFRRAYADIDFGGEHSGCTDMFNNPQPPKSNRKLKSNRKFQSDLLDRLLPHLPTTGTCYLATDSHLQILPFHLLKTADGEYFGDRYQLHHLTTARDLLRRSRIPTSENPPLFFADPDYDGGMTPILLTHPKTGLELSDRLDGREFDRLKINRQFGERVAKSYQANCYTDIKATVDRLERLNAPKLLFIATHGFSLPAVGDLIETIQNCARDEETAILRNRASELTPKFRAFWQQYADAGSEWCQRIVAKIDEVGINRQPTDLLSQPADDPMLRSGIALAGANIWRFQGQEDPKFGKGVVFADDITQWNLWGTELSVLVTCVSGLGAVTNSEGVFGLRRALAIAGAKYVISSLWNIPTKPSVLLMNKFFEIYQSSAKPTPAVALVHAQSYIRHVTLGELKQSTIGREIVKELLEGQELLEVQERVLSSISTDDVKPLADPYFWGAWICQG